MADGAQDELPIHEQVPTGGIAVTAALPLPVSEIEKRWRIAEIDEVSKFLNRRGLRLGNDYGPGIDRAEVHLFRHIGEKGAKREGKVCTKKLDSLVPVN
jgi:hypothetical protein